MKDKERKWPVRHRLRLFLRTREHTREEDQGDKPENQRWTNKKARKLERTEKKKEDRETKKKKQKRREEKHRPAPPQAFVFARSRGECPATHVFIAVIFVSSPWNQYIPPHLAPALHSAKVIIITFALCSMHAWLFTHACCFAQPGHWLGSVTGLGVAGSSPAVLVELDPTPKKT